MLPQVTAIVVNWNGKADTLECLGSLYASQDVDLQVIVVDNGSQDGSCAAIRAAFPDVILLETGTNLGFCGGNNAGISHALQTDCEWIFLVNNDTVLEPDCLHQLLVGTGGHSEVVLSPAIYKYADRSSPWFLGSSLDWREGRAVHQDDARKVDTTAPFAIPWVNGCAMLISASILRSIGGFDERFFCYCEDVDWSLRAQQQGVACLLNPAAVLYHKVSASAGFLSPLQEYYMTRNRLLLMAKHTRGWQRLAVQGRIGRSALHNAITSLRGKNPFGGKRLACYIIYGLFDFCRQRFGLCRHTWPRDPRTSL